MDQTAINSHRAFRQKMREEALRWRRIKPRAKKYKAEALAAAIYWRDAAAEFYKNWIEPFKQHEQL